MQNNHNTNLTNVKIRLCEGRLVMLIAVIIFVPYIALYNA